jgi:hypothetical protein
MEFSKQASLLRLWTYSLSTLFYPHKNIQIANNTNFTKFYVKHPVVFQRIIKIKYRKNNKIKLLLLLLLILIYFMVIWFDQHWSSSGNQHHRSYGTRFHDLVFVTEKWNVSYWQQILQSVRLTSELCTLNTVICPVDIWIMSTKYCNLSGWHLNYEH